MEGSDTDQICKNDRIWALEMTEKPLGMRITRNEGCCRELNNGEMQREEGTW